MKENPGWVKDIYSSVAIMYQNSWKLPRFTRIKEHNFFPCSFIFVVGCIILVRSTHKKPNQRMDETKLFYITTCSLIFSWPFYQLDLHYQ